MKSSDLSRLLANLPKDRRPISMAFRQNAFLIRANGAGGGPIRNTASRRKALDRVAL
jgi:hypothetical protein